MKKITTLISLIVYLCAITVMPSTVRAQVLVPITAPSAVLLDHNTNRFVYAKTPHLQRAPASTTKILTSMVALDQLHLNQTITIPAFVKHIEPSKIHLRPGERYYVRDLIRATLINSANDAAETLAHVAGGSRAGFAQMMNAKARSLGAKDSHFVRASGLPARNQYSTAYDMSLIMRAAQRYPFIVETMKIRNVQIRSLSGRRINLHNHNKMLWRDHREILGKTGWTRNAKHCFVGRIRVQSQQVFVAMLGSRKLWRDLKMLVDYQFGASINKVRQNRKLWTRKETRNIQTALKRAGFNPGPVDGEWGRRTIRAIQGFQQSHGLSADGVVGNATWSKLSRYL